MKLATTLPNDHVRQVTSMIGRNRDFSTGRDEYDKRKRH